MALQKSWNLPTSFVPETDTHEHVIWGHFEITNIRVRKLLNDLAIPDHPPAPRAIETSPDQIDRILITTRGDAVLPPWIAPFPKRTINSHSVESHRISENINAIVVAVSILLQHIREQMEERIEHWPYSIAVSRHLVDDLKRGLFCILAGLDIGYRPIDFLGFSEGVSKHRALILSLLLSWSNKSSYGATWPKYPTTLAYMVQHQRINQTAEVYFSTHRALSTILRLRPMTVAFALALCSLELGKMLVIEFDIAPVVAGITNTNSVR